MKPQVIFDSKDTLRDKAAEVGIPVVNCLFTTFDEMKKSIELSATVFGGNAPKTVNKYNKELTKTVDEVEKKTKDLSDSDRPKVMHGNSVYTLTIDGTSPSGPAYPPVPKRHAAPRRAEGPRAFSVLRTLPSRRADECRARANGGARRRATNTDRAGSGSRCSRAGTAARTPPRSRRQRSANRPRVPWGCARSHRIRARYARKGRRPRCP